MISLNQSLRFFTEAALVAVLAPTAYWLAGMPFARATRTEGWALLWGCGLLGLGAELARIMGWPVVPATLGLAALGGIYSIWVLAFDRLTGLRTDLLGDLRRGAESYGIALVAVTAVPFALPGLWGGDWLLALDSGRSLAAGSLFTPDLLARPPFFGAASIPAGIVGDPLASFQVFCAIASASLLQVVRTLIPPGAHPRALWLLGGGVFFLQVTANAWPKMLAAAFVIASWIVAGRKTFRDGTVAGLLFGFALATHQSSVIFAPLVLVRLCAGLPRRTAVRHSAALLVATVAICAPWEMYTISTYGLKAKILANPAVAARLGDTPAWLNAGLVGLSTVVAWEPATVLHHWLTSDAPFSPLRIQKDAYWLVTAWFNVSAASLAGIMLPWLVAVPLRRLGAGLGELARRMTKAEWVALAVSFIGQAMLNPYYSRGGSLHTGWVPAGVGLVCWLTAWLSRQPRSLQSRVIGATVCLGLIPWVMFQYLLTAGVVVSGRLREQIAATDDLQWVTDRGWHSLGMGAFPWIQALIVVGLVAYFAAGRRQLAGGAMDATPAT